MNAPLSAIGCLTDSEMADPVVLRAVEGFCRGVIKECRDLRIEQARDRCKRKADRQYGAGDQQGFINTCHRIQRLNRLRRPEVTEQMDAERLAACRRRGV